MAIYQPRQGGHTAKLPRVTALRRLAETGVVSFEQYVRSEPPTFVIRNCEGMQRTPTGREVPVYLLGANDLWLSIREAMPDVVNTAFANPEVVDRESLGEAIVAELTARYGEAVTTAAGMFSTDADDVELVNAS